MLGITWKVLKNKIMAFLSSDYINLRCTSVQTPLAIIFSEKGYKGTRKDGEQENEGGLGERNGPCRVSGTSISAIGGGGYPTGLSKHE